MVFVPWAGICYDGYGVTTATLAGLLITVFTLVLRALWALWGLWGLRDVWQRLSKVDGSDALGLLAPLLQLYRIETGQELLPC